MRVCVYVVRKPNRVSCNYTMRKDIKKSSYYVWFLGAQEAKGLRGIEYVLPVVRSLVERERIVEPFKVTLQVSHKGLKIIQNIPGTTVATAKATKLPKTETVKHFIPHHAVTCVLQQEDIVSCILLLYNPITKCPVHVHAYRCDSVETAQILCGQLQTLIERPDNQKKLLEIETRLRAKGLLGVPSTAPARPVTSGGGGGSDGRSNSTRESESSAGSSSERLSGASGGGPPQERIANLYDSLAAELREKLCTDPKGRSTHAPILLPPRDYDTVHRQKGDLSNVDRRRCLNTSIVGINAKNAEAAVGPTSTPMPGGSGKRARPARAPLVGSSGGSSGIGSDDAPSPDQDLDPRFLDNGSSSDEEWGTETANGLLLLAPRLSAWRATQHGELSLPRARRVASVEGTSPTLTSPTSPTTPPITTAATTTTTTQPRAQDHTEQYVRQPSWREQPPEDEPSSTSRSRSRHLSEEDISSPDRTFSSGRRRVAAEQRQRTPRTPSPKRASTSLSGPVSGPMSGPLSPKERFQDAKDKFLSLERERIEEQERALHISLEKRRFSQPEPPISPAVQPAQRRPRWQPPDSEGDDEEDHVEDGGVEEYPDRHEFSGRQQVLANVARREGRPTRRSDENGEEPLPPIQRPRPTGDPQAYRGALARSRSVHRVGPDPDTETPLERYRSPPSRGALITSPHHVFAEDERKRRSMFEAQEEERRRHSNELAREFKRRSHPADGYHELDERDRYPGLDRDTARLAHHAAVGQRHVAVSPNYRHSYAEAPVRTESMQHHEVLQRTGSSVSSARVGLAAVHPY